jgi:polyvinyl alcohol dehydrogenase (cytochrome)
MAFASVPPLELRPTGQSPDAANIYKQKCSTCHDSAAVRAPDRDAMKQLTPESILASLTSGTMAAQGEGLSAVEKRAVAEFLAGKPLGRTDPLLGKSPSCRTGPTALYEPLSRPRWNGWGADVANTRFQSERDAGLSAAQVPKLTLKWAFGFPEGRLGFAQPTLAGGRVFVGSDKGAVYSLDSATGCTYWSFTAEAGVRTAMSIGPLTGTDTGRRSAGSARNSAQSAPVEARYAVYFGDLRANVYALDAATGARLWSVRVDEHQFARITGAPVLEGQRLYVPVSSVEEVAGPKSNYECCRFRGSVVALDAATGKQIWKSYTISQAPQPVSKNDAGTQLWAPAGAAVWTSPTIDLKARALYVGTGNAYTSPAADTSDAVVAFDLDTGKMLWSRQVTPKDVFLVGCAPGAPPGNCPETIGPDYDIGTSPILRTLAGGRRILVVGQKSGVVYGLDPDRQGEIVWQFRAGKGGLLGGIEWGMAADEELVYVPVSDVLGPPEAAGGLFGLRLATGERVWHTPAPKLECTGGRGCTGAQSAAISAIPGIVFSGSVDGHFRAYSTVDGKIVWDFNTVQDYVTVNGVPGRGGSLDSAGPTVAAAMVFTNSGYGQWRGLPGNVLLAFAVQ